MEGTLRVSPEQLRATASDFSTKGTEVKNILGEMTQLVTNLGTVWEGEASQAYIRQFNELNNDMEKMNRMIQEHCSDLNEMAMQYETADKANKGTSESLSTDVII